MNPKKLVGSDAVDKAWLMRGGDESFEGFTPPNLL